MNILWIPHNTWGEGRYQRDQYFIRCLSKKHVIHVMQWGDYLPHTCFNMSNPDTYIKNMRFYTKKHPDYYIHHMPRLPDVNFGGNALSFSTCGINQFLRSNTIKKISRSYNIDVIVTGNIGENTPIPSTSPEIPVIVDYVDLIKWSEKREKETFKNADAVITVSSVLYERAKLFNDNTSLITNGVDIEKFSNLDGSRIKKKLGLEHNKVVSVIGLTYSSLYFIDAVLLAKQKIPSLKCILVGRSDSILQYLQKNDYFNNTFIYTGPVAYDSISDYFAVSDVGLYPVDETPYYDAASPIKLFEYTAARKPVVLPRIKEMMRIGFPNLIFASPTKELFTKAIIKAIIDPILFTDDIKNYDWQILVKKFESLIDRVLKN